MRAEILDGHPARDAYEPSGSGIPIESGVDAQSRLGSCQHDSRTMQVRRQEAQRFLKSYAVEGICCARSNGSTIACMQGNVEGDVGWRDQARRVCREEKY